MFDVQILGRIPYQEGWDTQKEWVKAIDQQQANNQLLLLEHEHTITLGRGTHTENLLLSADEYRERDIAVVEIDRGGDVTYHGPGQLVAYPLFYLGRHGHAKRYLRQLEEVIIQVLAYWGIHGSRKEAYTGVWVEDKKIAAIGVKFNRARYRGGYISSHGFALNLNTDLSYFQTIIPCGIQEYTVTSVSEQISSVVSMQTAMEQVVIAMQNVFGEGDA